MLFRSAAIHDALSDARASARQADLAAYVPQRQEAVQLAAANKAAGDSKFSPRSTQFAEYERELQQGTANRALNCDAVPASSSWRDRAAPPRARAFASRPLLANNSVAPVISDG